MNNLKYLILIIFLIFFQSNSFGCQNSISDSIKIEKYINHFNTLNYIARKNYSNPYFLNKSKQFLDSILLINKKNSFSNRAIKELNTTKSTIENNLINKFKLFDFYSGIPSYYAFVDDPIEYAYDDAFNALLNSKYLKLHNGPLSEANITSILIREDCDDEMFEIINQTLIVESNHHIIQQKDLIEILGVDGAEKIINNKYSLDDLNNLLNKYELDKLGVFKVNNIDIINNKIWFVNAEFNIFSKTDGFSEPIFNKGYSIDKRDKGIISFTIISSFFLILILVVYFNFGKVNLVFSKKNFKFIFIDAKNFAIYFVLPLIISCTLIYFLSLVSPKSQDHFLEFNVISWVFLSSFLTSLFPIIINLFVINRSNIDGFHTSSGYIKFISITLAASFLPSFLFLFIKYDLPYFEIFEIIFLLTFVSLSIGVILGNSFFQLSSISNNHENYKSSLIGFSLSLILLLVVKTILLLEFSSLYLLLVLIFLTIINGFYFLIQKKQNVEFTHKENYLKNNVDNIYIDNIIDVKKNIFDVINENKSNSLNIYIISAYQGIGKTTALKKAKEYFLEENWEVFYGDCDEIQTDDKLSFEPFLEAFRLLIKSEEFIDRSSKIDNLSKAFVNTFLDNTIHINPIKDFVVNSEANINNICFEIAEKLKSINSKILFVLEDIHWIDSETISFLKHFIKVINRYPELREKMTIIFSLRSDIKTEYRGLSNEELTNELNDINNQVENEIYINKLLDSSNYNVKNYCLSLNLLNFKIASKTLIELNDFFNNLIINQEDINLIITPLYINKCIERWIKLKILISTKEGFILSKAIDIDEMPNSQEIDVFYHETFNFFDKKWIRLLESATVIGYRFDANIIAKLWGYNILEVLTFLEEAVEKELLIDLSDFDNYYEFKDKGIISAIKSYFKNDKIQLQGEKQIIVEYNKRYLEIVNELIEYPHKYTLEEILIVSRRIVSLNYLDFYSKKCDKIIIEVVLRFLYKNQYEQLYVYGTYLTHKGLNNVGKLICNISDIVNKIDVTDEKKIIIRDGILIDQEKFNNELINGYHSNLLNELRLISLLAFDNNELKGINQIETINFDLSFNDWNYLFNEFPKRLRGESLMYYITNFLVKLYNSELFISDESSIIDKDFKKNLSLYFSSVKIDYEILLKLEIFNIEHNLFCLKNHLTFGDSIFEEYSIDQIEKSSNTKKTELYEELINNSIAKRDLKLIYKCLLEFIEFINHDLQDYELSILMFDKYHKELLDEGRPNEFWLIQFFHFIMSSTCNCKKTFYNKKCNCVKTGEVYISKNNNEVNKKFKVAKSFLNKVTEEDTLSYLTKFYYKSFKVYLLSMNQTDEIVSLINDYIRKFKKTYSESSEEYEKCLVDHSNELIEIFRFKESNNLLEASISFLKNNNVAIKNSRLSQRYNRLSENYIKLKNFSEATECSKTALVYIEKSLREKEIKNWTFVENQLIADPKKSDEELFLYGNLKEGKGKLKPAIKNYSSILYTHAKCLFYQNKHLEADIFFEKSLKYSFENFDYINHNIKCLRKAINFFKIDNLEGEKQISMYKNNLKINNLKKIQDFEIRLDSINAVIREAEDIVGQ